jgi:hypothetical protein
VAVQAARQCAFRRSEDRLGALNCRILRRGRRLTGRKLLWGEGQRTPIGLRALRATQFHLQQGVQLLLGNPGPGTIRIQA